jgi:hypothetical protein
MIVGCTNIIIIITLRQNKTFNSSQERLHHVVFSSPSLSLPSPKLLKVIHINHQIATTIAIITINSSNTLKKMSTKLYQPPA